MFYIMFSIMGSSSPMRYDHYSDFIMFIWTGLFGLYKLRQASGGVQNNKATAKITSTFIRISKRQYYFLLMHLMYKHFVPEIHKWNSVAIPFAHLTLLVIFIRLIHYSHSLICCHDVCPSYLRICAQGYMERKLQELYYVSSTLGLSCNPWLCIYIHILICLN